MDYEIKVGEPYRHRDGSTEVVTSVDEGGLVHSVETDGGSFRGLRVARPAGIFRELLSPPPITPSDRVAMAEERKATVLAKRLRALYDAIGAVGTPAASWDKARAVLDAMGGAKEALELYEVKT